MAEVFSGESARGERAAVKILHGGVASDPELLARFWREVEIAGEIGHPGVVRVIDHGLADDGRPYLAMELLEGSTLADLSKRPGGIPLPELLGYVDQLLDVLAAAHDRSVVHRDLKPANLFVTRDGRLKVLDFGIARLLEQGPDDLRTATGVAMGTVAYMAPEQAAGLRDRIDGRTDLFAVGAILFRLLSGRRVHEAPGQAQLLLKMASEPAPPLASVAPNVQPAIAAVVDCALAFEKERRFPDARVMRAALHQAMGPSPHAPALGALLPAEPTVISGSAPPRAEPAPSGGPIPTGAPVPTGAPAPRSNRALALVVGLVGVSIALLAAAAVGYVLLGFWLTEQKPDGPEPVDLDRLLGAYRTDPRVAKQIYGSKVIRTSGKTDQVDPEFIRIGGSAPPWVECWLRPMPSVAPGAHVTVQGTVTAWHEDPPRVVLSPCQVEP